MSLTTAERKALKGVIFTLHEIDSFVSEQRKNGLDDYQIMNMPMYVQLGELALDAEELWCGNRPDISVYLQIGNSAINAPDINFASGL
jgi:hypothetical protein